MTLIHEGDGVVRDARPQPHADQESTEVADQVLDKP